MIMMFEDVEFIYGDGTVKIIIAADALFRLLQMDEFESDEVGVVRLSNTTGDIE